MQKPGHIQIYAFDPPTLTVQGLRSLLDSFVGELLKSDVRDTSVITSPPAGVEEKTTFPEQLITSQSCS